MTLIHLHHDDVQRLGREQRLPFRHVLRWIGRALRTLHQAIVRAKLRRLQSEMMFRQDYGDLFPPEQDVAKFPQRPLVLGDKWDF
jgi:hypothetical protein